MSRHPKVVELDLPWSPPKYVVVSTHGVAGQTVAGPARILSTQEATHAMESSPATVTPGDRDGHADTAQKRSQRRRAEHARQGDVTEAAVPPRADPKSTPTREVKSMSPKPTTTKTRQDAEAAVQAALADGKITDQSLPAWRKHYERDPAGTAAELRQLVSVPRYAIRASDGDEQLLQRTRSALGLTPSARSATTSAASSQGAASGAGRAQHQGRPGGQGAVDALRSDPSRKGRGNPSGSVNPLGAQYELPDPGARQSLAASGAGASGPAHQQLFGGATAPATPRAAELTRTEHGNVLWGGVPTSMSERGTLQVYYGSDWLDIDEAQRRGITPQDSALSIGTAPTIGGAAHQRLLDRLPSGSPLGFGVT